MIKVSVVTITYGHEKFIGKCIEGVLLQEGNFELEFIISNDKSPDKTSEIVNKYRLEHSKGSCIRFIDHQKNIGIMPNFYETINSSTGDYIAICDGDDYWTDPLKIQKQVDFLEANQDYILVGHNVQIFDNKTNDILNDSFPFKEKQNQISEDQIFKKNYIPALSIMYRNVSKLPDWILDCKIGDYPLVLHYSQYGKIGFLNDVMASYRSNTGYHSSISKKIQNEMLVLSLEIVLNKIKISETHKNLLRYQLLNLEISYINFNKSILKIYQSKISLDLKMKALINKLS